MVDPGEALAAIGRVGAIASSSGSAQERAEAVVESLGALVPHVAAEIVMLNPLDGS